MRRSILLVDDDLVQLKIVSFILEQGGFDVSTASDGYGAYDLFEKKVFDLVILDINLPGLKGFTILQNMRNTDIGKKIPIMMLSGRNDSMSVLKSKALGADDYLIKPVERDLLMRKVTTLIGRQPQEVELIFEEHEEWTKAKVQFDFSVRSLSSKGMIVLSRIPLEVGMRIKSCSYSVFEKLKINSVSLHVVDCSDISNHKDIKYVGDYKYELLLTIEDISKQDLGTLREWIIETSLKQKANQSTKSIGSA